MGRRSPNDRRFPSEGIRVADRKIAAAWIALAMLLVPTIVLLIIYLSGYDGRTWPESVQPLILTGWFGGFLLGIGAIVLSTWSTPRRGAIEVKEQEVIVERENRITSYPRSDIQGAYVVGDHVRIAARPHKEVVVELAPELREPLVGALDFAVEMRRNSCEFGNDWLRAVGVYPPLLGMGAAFIVSGLLVVGGGNLKNELNLIAGAVWLAVTIATAAATPWRRVTVGVDGLWVETLLTGRFVPLVEVGALKSERWWHQLTRTNNRHVRLCWTIGAGAPQCMALAARIRALQSAANAARPIPVEVLATLERGSEPFQKWISRLRALNAEVGAYRIAPNRLEELRIALLSPRSSVEQRIGAAVALMAGEGGQANIVRQAVESVARPATRRALREVAEGKLTETALANALLS